MIKAVIDIEVFALCCLKEVSLEPTWPYTQLLVAMEKGAFRPVFFDDMRTDLKEMLWKSKRLGKAYAVGESIARSWAERMFKRGYEVSITGEEKLGSDDWSGDLIEAAILGKAKYIVSSHPPLFEVDVQDDLRVRGIICVLPLTFLGILLDLPF